MDRNNRDIALIKRYLKGELNAREMHELERRAQHDPLLMDLMTGMEIGEPREHEAAIAAIQQQLHQRISPSVKERKLPGVRWMAAATLVFALLVVGVWFLKRDQPTAPAVVQHAPPTRDQPIVSEPYTVDSTPRIAANPPMKKRVAASIPVKKQKDVPQMTARKTLDNSKIDTPTSVVADQAIAALVKKDSQEGLADRPVIISGTVTDQVSREPLQGVVVNGIQGSATQTDSNGRFALAVPKDNQQLALSYIGYEHQRVNAQGRGEDSLLIAMQPANEALNEVVVVGYGKQQKRLLTGRVQGAQASASTGKVAIVEARKVTEPLIGWRAYKKYLAKATQVSTGNEGVVTIAFHITKEGKPTDLFVLKGLNEELNERAQDIIRKGSAWKQLPNDSTWVKLEVVFK
ncbi:carboxypeptidase-like regulatory domain-containing protein [Olivibacter ginsenosidimutans]|uniref:Carboxypeptidase-like regulatory domain-containing protein n=1 Tax=Olivibacter ginsenosidimutans TaxID=1176537 RepID=A0ABP9C2F7_9SPHI